MSDVLQIVLKEVEVQKLSLKPDDILVVKLRGDIFNEDVVDNFSKALRKALEGHRNKVLVWNLPDEAEIELTTVQQEDTIKSGCSNSFCDDCTCGKKELNTKGEE